MSLKSNFRYTTVNGLTVLEFAPWAGQGIVHGFIGKTSEGEGAGSPEDKLLCAYGLDNLIYPKQSHGNSVIDMRSSALGQELDGDSIIVPRRAGGRKTAYAIRTADCLPIFIRAGSDMALVHAGWRGLANGILPKTIHAFNLTGSGPIEAVIGPAASPRCYEVGPEVLDAIGRHLAVYHSLREKFLLDLPGTAQQILMASLGDRVVVHNSGVCTLSDPLFHSYRRDGVNAGRNLAFFIPY